MKNIYKKAIYWILGLASLCTLTSCENSYNELPPKTDQAVKYALPDPVYPEAEEIALLKEIRKEHNDETN